ncbi:hypothetical protein MKL09_07090, partial [Methylobacterium sp. J-048]|nr:hypothetical protein [Methylobacterium sp. J-048]
RARWSAHTPWNGDFGDAQFIDPIDIFADPEKNAPFIVKDGILKIRARHPDGNLVPVLAATIPSEENGTLAADGRSGVWKIKPGVTGHDGRPLTADERGDVLAARVGQFLEPADGDAHRCGELWRVEGRVAEMSLDMRLGALDRDGAMQRSRNLFG